VSFVFLASLYAMSGGASLPLASRRSSAGAKGAAAGSAQTLVVAWWRLFAGSSWLASLYSHLCQGMSAAAAARHLPQVPRRSDTSTAGGAVLVRCRQYAAVKD